MITVSKTKRAQADDSMTGAVGAETTSKHGFMLFTIKSLIRSRQQKKLFFGAFAAVFATVVSVLLFYGCKKDSEGGTVLEINATNVINSSSEIATVKAKIEGYGYEVASAEYKNGGFKLKLSKTVSDEYLMKPQNLWNIPSNMVSDKNTLFGKVHLDAYNNAGKEIGNFCQKDDNYGIGVYIYWGVYWYVYANKSCTIKGESNYATWDCTFKKGWNIVYIYSDDLFTTNKPSGVNFKWYFR